MPRNRTPAKNSKYYVEKELYLTVMHYCRMYPGWCAELAIEPDTSKAITYDKSRAGNSISDPVSTIAMHRATIAKKKEDVEKVAAEVADRYAKWIILSVCYGKSYMELENMGMLCARDSFYVMRRRFYYAMSKKI